MLPFTRKTAANAKVVLDTISEGHAESYPYNTYSDGTYGDATSLPLFTDAPSDLVTAVISANLTPSTSYISTGTLSSQSTIWLQGIRSRVDEAVADIYADTPANSPYYYANAVIKSAALRENARDKIIQNIFKYDARYYGRLRTSTTYSGRNYTQEYPSRHNYMNPPTVIAHLKEHGITNITGIDDNGSSGAYRITSSAPHGLYDYMSIYSNGADTGSAATKRYWLANVYSEISSLVWTSEPGDDTNAKFYFNSNIGTNYLIDANTIVSGNTTVGYYGGGILINTGSGTNDWIPLRWQPTRYFKLVDGGAAFEFYYDSALTDKIYPGYGYVSLIKPGYYNSEDDPNQGLTGGIAVTTCTNATGGWPSNKTHMMFEDTPQLFAPPSGWTGNASIYERKTVTSTNAWTGLWYIASPGNFSIHDGQLTNFAGMNSLGWENIHFYTVPLYFKKIAGNNFELYTDAALTSKWYLGEESNTLSSISYSGGIARFTFSSDYVPLVNTLPIYTSGTTTAFSNVRVISSKTGSSPETLTLDANHAFQNGQPVRLTQNTSQVLYAKTQGLPANQVQLFTSVSWSGSTPTFSGYYTATTTNTIAPVFYMKRISATVWECYVDPALSVGYTVVNSLTGATTGSIGRSIISNAMSTTPPSGAYLQPMFYTRMESYYSATLWVDAARTIPYTYYEQDGGLGTTTIKYVWNANGGGTYYINNIGHKMKFGTGSSDNLDGWMGQAYFVNASSSTTVDLYADPGLNYRITQPATASVAGGSFIASYLDDNVNSGRYRLDYLETINMGGETYWYDSDGDGTDDTVDAVFEYNNNEYYTTHYETNRIGTFPSVIVEEYRSANAGPYYGRLRNVVSSGSTTAQGPVVQSDTTTYNSVGSGPCYYNARYPGRFYTSSDVLMRLQPKPDGVAVTITSDQIPLANTAPEWDTISNMTDRTLRYWPSTIQPASVTWTIEQPNQTFETQNLNRYVRAKEQTQYRIRAVYPPMTRSQFKEYHDIILSARGSFKPMKLKMPTYGGTSQLTDSMFGRYFNRIDNTYMPYQARFRRSANGGQRLIELDGLPRLRDQADSAGTGELYTWGIGHPCAMANRDDLNTPGYKSQLGGWIIPIHNVETNEYGEANMRINNGVPTYCDVGTIIYRDAGDLDVFLDGNSIETKVDARGFHWLEVEFISKRIF